MGLLNRLFSLTENDRFQIWRHFGSFRANSLAKNDTNLIEDGYETNVDVFSVIKKVTDTAKGLPFVVERRSSDGWEVINDTSLNELIAKPNRSKKLSFEDILERALIYINSTGNAYFHGLVPEGFKSIEELDVLPSQYIEPISNGSFFFPEVAYQMRFQGNLQVIPGEDVGHVRFFNPAFTNVSESLKGLSPIEVAAQVVQAGNDRWEADANLLQNRGAIGLVTDGSNRPMDDTEAKAVQGHFDKRTTGAKNFGKVIVTNKDLKYIQMAMSSTDLQLIEKGVVNLRAICNVFGLDSSLFNDPANKTFNNRKEAEKALYTNAVMPIMNKIEQKLNVWLVPTHFPNGDHRLRVDYSGIPALQEDFNQKASIVVNLKTSGIITANEARMKLDLPEATDENADKLVVSAGLKPLEEINVENNSGENS